MTENTSYDANELTHLEGLDSVRKRPGMYLGNTSTGGLQHTIAEVMDNAVDESLAGHCSRIEVTLHADGSVEVSDNGRGIPVDVHKKTGLPALIGVFTLLHFGGKFGGGGYKSAGGLHGVGASVTNAVSQRLDVEVCRNDRKYLASFARGKTAVFEADGPDAAFVLQDGIQDGGAAPKGFTGTRVRWWPDAVVFLPEAEITREYVVERARKTAFIVPNLAIQVRDLRGPDMYEETFEFAGGIRDMVDFLTVGKPLCDITSISGTGTFNETIPVLDEHGQMVSTNVERTVEVSVALRWDSGYDANVQSYVNVVTTPNGGTHNKGFERGILNALRKGYEGTRLIRATDDPPILEDVLEGLTAVISVSVPEPQFVGQTKDELGTQGVLKIVQDIVGAGIKTWVEGAKTKAQARLVLEKISNAARNRVASRTQREAARRKTALEGASMPAKLVDCRAIGVDRSEIFLVEGDSALGTARQGRNSEYQALLPLRGKILNVQKASLSDMLNNAECAAIIQCIGAGSGRSFDIDQMRYGRVMLMADADVDGSHIRALLLTLFHRYMRPIIEAGRLYAAMPPLHKVEVTGRGGETIYTYTAEELAATLARLEKAGKKVKTPIQRFKGLGEMNPEELWLTTMSPLDRSVRRITLEDAAAGAAMLDLLMGDAVAPRREWIISNRDKVGDLNI